MTRVPFDDSWGFAPPPPFWEALNSLMDDNKKFTTSTGETIELGQSMRVLFVAPPSVVTVMSPAALSRLGIVNGSGKQNLTAITAALSRDGGSDGAARI